MHVCVIAIFAHPDVMKKTGWTEERRKKTLHFIISSLNIENVRGVQWYGGKKSAYLNICRRFLFEESIGSFISIHYYWAHDGTEFLEGRKSGENKIWRLLIMKVSKRPINEEWKRRDNEQIIFKRWKACNVRLKKPNKKKVQQKICATIRWRYVVKYIIIFMSINARTSG